MRPIGITHDSIGLDNEANRHQKWNVIPIEMERCTDGIGEPKRLKWSGFRILAAQSMPNLGLPSPSVAPIGAKSGMSSRRQLDSNLSPGCLPGPGRRPRRGSSSRQGGAAAPQPYVAIPASGMRFPGSAIKRWGWGLGQNYPGFCLLPNTRTDDHRQKRHLFCLQLEC